MNSINKEEDWILTEAQAKVLAARIFALRDAGKTKKLPEVVEMD